MKLWFTGKRYELDGSPATWIAVDDGSEVPLEVARKLDRKLQQKLRRQHPPKRGRPKLSPGETRAEQQAAYVDERGLAAAEQHFSELKPSTVERNWRKYRPKNR